MAQGNDKSDDPNGSGQPTAPRDQVIAAISSLTEQYRASQQERAEHDRKVFLWTKRATIGVGIYTLLTLGGVVLTYCALRTSQDGLVAARQANEIAIRPYVKIIFRPETFVIPKSGDAYRFIDFSVENTGKLPASVSVASAISWQGPGHNITPGTFGGFNGVGSAFIFPEQRDLKLSTNGVGITEGQFVDLIAAREGKIYASVRATYGKDWETEVCTVFPMKIDGSTIRISERGTKPCEDDYPNTQGMMNYAK